MSTPGLRRIMVVNKFLHHVGGVETYVAWQARELAQAGYETAFFGMTPPPGESLMNDLDGPVYESPNRDYYGSRATALKSAATAVYSRAVEQQFRAAVDDFRPDVIHIHSTCYQLTPSVVRVVNEKSIPSITSAHEYKFVCSNQRLWDDGAARPCYECVSKSTPARVRSIVSTRCVKGKLSSSLIAAAELPVSQSIWKRYRGLVHAPSQYMETILQTSGSPVSGRVRYLDLPWGTLDTADTGAGYGSAVTYIGRLSREKGVDVLVKAWPLIQRSSPDSELRIYGSGADEERLRSAAAGLTNVSFLGRYSAPELEGILSASAVTVHPSIWAENSPFTVRESLLRCVPAVVSDVGGQPELIDERVGRTFAIGDPAALAEAVLTELTLKRARTTEMRDAVASRVLTDAGHMDGMLGLYAEAATATR